MGGELITDPGELAEAAGLLPDTGPHGFGLIPSPPDERDFDVADVLDALEASAILLPSSYVAPHMPSVLNQGATPMCVAYTDSAIKGQQDRGDQGQFFNFDEPYFFRLIGGNANGAVLRNGLERMRLYGYPIVGGGVASQHKIAAYYSVPKTVDAIKQAIYLLGPIQLGVHWYNSWMRPYSNGVLPRADWYTSGHDIAAYGWDARGLRLRQSWGTAWGLGGDCFMPWAMVLSSAVFEIWKAADQIIKPPGTWKGRGRVYGPNCNIRAQASLSGTIFARSQSDGYIHQLSNGSRLWPNSTAFLFNGRYVNDFAEVKTGAGKVLYIHRSVFVVTVKL
jgi:papain like protease